MARKRLGEILIVAGVLKQEQLEDGLRAQKQHGGKLGKVLVSEGLISEDLLVRALSKQLNIPMVELRGVDVNDDVLAIFPGDVCRELGVIAFRLHGQFVDLAMSDPMDSAILAQLRIRTNLTVRPHLATSIEIAHALERNFPGAGRVATPLPQSTARQPVTTPRPPAGRAAKPNTADVAALQRRVATLEALVSRDEDVIRKLVGLLIKHGVLTREEVVAAIGK